MNTTGRDWAGKDINIFKPCSDLGCCQWLLSCRRGDYVFVLSLVVVAPIECKGCVLDACFVVWFLVFLPFFSF